MRILGWLFCATLALVLFIQLRSLGSPLITETTPHGIVGYELAFSAARASEMITAWQNAGVIENARVSLGVDFAFLLAYPAFFFFSVRLLQRTDGSRLQAIGTWLGGAVLACAPLDAIENLALWRMLSHGATSLLAATAGIAASVKFALVIATAMWCLMALARRVAR
jgi:hypothetical protein